MNSTSVSIVLQKVGLTTHWSRLVYQQSYKIQVLRYTILDHRTGSPAVEQDHRTGSPAVEQDQRYTILDHRTGSPAVEQDQLDHRTGSPAVEQDQRFVGLLVGLLIHSVGLQVYRTIARRNINTHSIHPPLGICI